MKSKLLQLIIIIFFANVAQANDKGNGGDALRVGNKFYMLDQLEMGVEHNPRFSKSLKPDPKYTARLSKKFTASMVPIDLIALKLTEIATQDKVFALSILKTIEFYTWRWVNGKLIDVNDEDSVLAYAPEDLGQMAIRRDATIRVNVDLWKKMDSANQVALVFHEALYALIRENSKGIQSSPKVREVTGYLFTSDFEVNGVSSLHSLLGEDFLPDFPSLAYSAKLLEAPAAQLNPVYENDQGVWFASTIQVKIGVSTDPRLLVLGGSDSHYNFAAKDSAQSESLIQRIRMK